MRKVLLLLLGFVLVLSAKATHLVGGEMTYTRLGGNTIRVTLTIYRDNYNGSTNALFDGQPGQAEAIISIFNANGAFLQAVDLGAPNNITTIPQQLAACQDPIPNIDIQRGVYIIDIDLNTVPGYNPNLGVRLLYGRCCRNGNISNVNAPGVQGFSAIADVPPINIQNSSPVFNNFYQYLCEDRLSQLDFSATDIDGDSLVYSLCDPYQALDDNDPSATLTGLNFGGGPGIYNNYGPPYNTINWFFGYSATNPFGGTPPSFNSSTGILQATPNIAGVFTMAVCVSEYRNGVLLGTVQRDFQYLVSPCDFPDAEIQFDNSVPIDPTTGLYVIDALCNDGLVNFNLGNNFGINNYSWDFGDPTTTTDVSNLQNPSYFYSDTGTFIVTLIGTDNDGCSDTSRGLVRIYPVFAPGYTIDDTCQNTAVQFTDISTTTFGNVNSWDWDFGDPGSSNDNSLLQNPSYTYSQPGTFTSTLIVTTDKGCQETVTNQVTVHPEPTANFNLNNLCIGETASFTNQSTVSSGTITQNNWNFGDLNTSNQQNPSHTYASAGTYNVNLQVSTNQGCQDNITQQITVHPLPTITLTNDTIICDNDTLNLFAAGGQQYQWSPNYNIINSGSNNPSIFPDVDTTYIVQVTDINGCVDTDSVEVNVYDFNPDFTFVDSCLNIAAAFNDISTINPGTINSWNWNFGDLTTSNQQNPSHTYNAAGNYNVSVTIGSDVGCQETVTKAITIHPLPVLSFTTDTLCETQSVSFTNNSTIASGSINQYLWNFGDLGTSNQQNPEHTYATTGNYNVTLVGQSNLGCLDTINQNLFINPLPVIGLTNDTFICPHDSIQLNATGGLFYSWAPAIGLNNANINNPIHFLNTNATYTVTVIDGNACINTDSVSINKFALPPAYAGEDTSVCLNNNAPLVFNDQVQLQATGGISYSWTPNYRLTATNIANPIANPDTNTNYIVTVTDTNNCRANDTVRVTVLNPALDLISDPIDSLCFGDTIMVNVLDQGDITTYTWTPSTGLSNPTVNSPDFFPSVTTEYILQITNYCYGKSDSVLVEVIPLPNVTLPPVDSVCIDERPYQLQAQPSLDTYIWSTTDPTISATDIPNPTVSPNSDTWYYFTGIDTVGTLACANSDSIELLVHPLPDVAITDVPAFVCQFDTFTFNVLSNTGVQFVWDNNPYIINRNVQNASIVPADTSQYFVTAINVHGCDNRDSAIVNVMMPVTASVTPTQAEICFGEFVNLEASGGTMYQWLPANAFTSPTSPNTQAQPDSTTQFAVVVANACFDDTARVNVIVNPLPAVDAGPDITINRDESGFLNGNTLVDPEWTPFEWILDNPFSLTPEVSPFNTTDFILQATDPITGCKNYDTTTVNVNVLTLLALPTGFTPNGDGTNDIVAIIKYLNIDELLDFSIYDRWGERVYQTNDIRGEWDGTFKGEPLPISTYTWTIEARTKDNEVIRKTGNITLLR